MHTPRVSYAHLGAKVNSKHVDSLLTFFQEGVKPASKDRYGVEIEHLPVLHGSDLSVPYQGEAGVKALLMALRPYYQADLEYWERGQLLGLGRPGISISLEPGAQVEASIGPLDQADQLTGIYEDFRRELDPLADGLGFRLVTYGYQPRSSFTDIKVIPKSRYQSMTQYLGAQGQFGLCMMRCSASTQVSIDYRDEADAIAKLRLGSALGPILALFFRNSPYFEGQTNPYPLLRQRIWDFTDFQRTNIIPGLFDPRFSWEDYAIDVLATPLMALDLTHTPEAVGQSASQLQRSAFRENAADVYPDRRLNDYEVRHLLSTHFNDVRLKNLVELRHWDSLPIDRAQALTSLVGSLFYDPDRFRPLADWSQGLSEADVFAAKADIQAHGPRSHPYGRDMDQWRDLLAVPQIQEPGSSDPDHPGVAQH
ncbi:gamma-glutamylcysteine synthetase [Bifidobacterium aemilianum]|uniref:Glutamate--cysteine ligase n=1 Tax=Bifidobacterium aemilianum TaxID=2493120 RepID=A0A366KAI3_9BIFI|nr:glutamate-cysteine ligase family protein [Bifidobacterium aemilianum]RBP98609.1 gamma-glutamylcysteine synthetase [Bifidobacterium aemilianum]